MKKAIICSKYNLLKILHVPIIEPGMESIVVRVGVALLGLWIPAIPAGMTGSVEPLGGHVIPAGIAGIQNTGR